MNALRAIEVGIAEFNSLTLGSADQDPLKSTKVQENISEENQNKIDVVKYITSTSEKDENFSDFGYSVPSFPKLGSEFNKTHDFSGKDSYKIKSNSLKESQKIVKLSKKKMASAFFELLNTDNTSSKHITISIGGMLTNKISEKWSNYFKSHW